MFAHRVALIRGGDLGVGKFQVECGYRIGEVVFLGDPDDGCVDDGVEQDPREGDLGRRYLPSAHFSREPSPKLMAPMQIRLT